MAKVLEIQFQRSDSDSDSVSFSPSTEYSGLISFWIDWFDLFAVLVWVSLDDRTLKKLLKNSFHFSHHLEIKLIQADLIFWSIFLV